MECRRKGKYRQQQRENVLIKEEDTGSRDIVDDPSSLCYDLLHMGEVGIQQYHLRRLTGRITSAAHGDGAVCLLHGQDVIDTVPGHGDLLTI